MVCSVNIWVEFSSEKAKKSTLPRADVHYPFDFTFMRTISSATPVVLRICFNDSKACWSLPFISRMYGDSGRMASIQPAHTRVKIKFIKIAVTYFVLKTTMPITVPKLTNVGNNAKLQPENYAYGRLWVLKFSALFEFGWFSRGGRQNPGIGRFESNVGNCVR